MNSAEGAEKETRETIHRVAVDAFAKHVLTQEGIGRWLCQRPGDSAYSFRVVAAPGYLIVFGDVGDAILRASDRDMVAWVAGAIRSPDYLFEKVVHKERRLYLADVMAYLDERVAEARKDGNEECAAAEVKEELEQRLAHDDNIEARDWYEAWSEQGVGGADEECPEGWAPSMWWTLECLAWFSTAIAEHGVGSGDHDLSSRPVPLNHAESYEAGLRDAAASVTPHDDTTCPHLMEAAAPVEPLFVCEECGHDCRELALRGGK